mmetsp:Transcript_31713/g.40700  ORF Transcript_31713/g.40700 Transcript_31713/m.40700 type:complete len:205 (+) Transcript_31713:69-683(+)
MDWTRTLFLITGGAIFFVGNARSLARRSSWKRNAIEIVEPYQPLLFGRDSGWTGTTYADAAKFCQLQKEGCDICPFEAICLFGNTIPNELESQDKESWFPILNDPNKYVNALSCETESFESLFEGDGVVFDAVYCCLTAEEFMDAKNRERGPSESALRNLDEEDGEEHSHIYNHEETEIMIEGEESEAGGAPGKEDCARPSRLV